MMDDPLYSFGYGLSYSRFTYSDLTLSKPKIAIGETLDFEVIVKNIGDCTAAEVVQFYLSDLEASTIVPLHHLIGFQRVTLEPNERSKVKFTITKEMLSFINEDGKSVIEVGEFRLEVGGCSPGSRGLALGVPEPVNAVFSVV